jgi:hypothetical protein
LALTLPPEWGTQPPKLEEKVVINVRRVDSAEHGQSHGGRPHGRASQRNKGARRWSKSTRLGDCIRRLSGPLQASRQASCKRGGPRPSPKGCPAVTSQSRRAPSLRGVHQYTMRVSCSILTHATAMCVCVCGGGGGLAPPPTPPQTPDPPPPAPAAHTAPNTVPPPRMTPVALVDVGGGDGASRVPLPGMGLNDIIR